jgi:hypothetical protein
VEELVTAEAIDLLAARLRTPLQIELHLSLAFEEAYRMGEKNVTNAVVESILSKRIDDLEPTLTRHGYNVKSLSEQFNSKPTLDSLSVSRTTRPHANSRVTRTDAGCWTAYLIKGQVKKVSQDFFIQVIGIFLSLRCSFTH